MEILLDSSVLIAVLRKRLELGGSDGFFINPIVYAEVAYGFVNIGRDLVDFDRFLESRKISILDISLNTAKIFTQLKFDLKRELIPDDDLLVASSCLENKMKLWTLNQKHFKRVKGLELVGNEDGARVE